LERVLERPRDEIRQGRAALEAINQEELRLSFQTSGPAQGGSTQIIIQKTYRAPPGVTTMEAIIYVKPDGTVVLATYRAAKAKL
jgi:hypothetical protein